MKRSEILFGVLKLPIDALAVFAGLLLAYRLREANIDLLPRIQCPTVVLRLADRHLVPPEATRAVAALLPDARLLTMNYLEYPPQLFEFLGHPLPAGFNHKKKNNGGNDEKAN